MSLEENEENNIFLEHIHFPGDVLITGNKILFFDPFYF